MNMLLLWYLMLNLFCEAKCNVNETSSSAQPLSLRNFCPYNKFCHSDPLKEIHGEHFEPCCEECSCDSDCFETGSCCPDMPLSSAVDPKYPCRHLWDFGKDIVTPNTGYDNYWYHVIDGCPDLEKAISFLRCYKPTQFQDYVMVTDTKIGRVYRNKHCADCNGIRNYEKLNIRIECEDTDSLTSLATHEQREKYLMEYCSFGAHLSAKIKGPSHCVPQSRLLSTCNSAGSWDIYENEIVNECLAKGSGQNTIFRDDKSTHVSYYANVYCFLCNENFDVQKVDTCKRSDVSENQQKGFVSFQFILDTAILDEDTSTSRETTCHSTQIWDPFTMTCRQLFCPVGHIPYYGSCKKLLSNIEGYSLSINFEVLITYGNMSDDPVILRFFENRLTQEIGNDITCGLCTSRLLYGRNSTSQFFFRLELYAKEGCPYDILSRRIRILAIREKIKLEFRYRSQAFHAKLTLLFEDVGITSGLRRLVEKRYAFCTLLLTTDETVLLFCPAIIVSSTEVYELGLKHVLGHSQVQNSNATTQQVCVDDYFSVKQVNSAMAVTYCGTFCLLSMSLVVFVSL